MSANISYRRGDQYPILVLTNKGFALLNDKTACPELTLARQRPPSKAAPRARSRAEAESWEGVDHALFDRLRAVRPEIARSRGVPPYVIFDDATLREMARLRPASLRALLAVKGVGARMADDLGETFLAAWPAPGRGTLQRSASSSIVTALPRIEPPGTLRLTLSHATLQRRLTAGAAAGLSATCETAPSSSVGVMPRILLEDVNDLVAPSRVDW